mmetsp:Transcript_10205/g.9014  ORF Transcript_10205/g.9014 Transcript_10205/m.9014 type:complete len:83 (+) Transcript_10205:188-436(+)
MQFDQGFSQEFMEFLLIGEKYKEFKLKINLNNVKEIILFSDFISSICHPSELNFHQIYIPLRPTLPDPELVNITYYALENIG